MEVQAINRIIELALAASERNLLNEHTPAIVLGENIRSLEPYLEGRSRFRGKFSTATLDDYVAYLKRHNGGSTFIDSKDMKATTLLNIGTDEKPGHCDWTASLALEPTAAYAALNKIEGQPQKQRSLVEWVEDWVSLLSAEKDGEVMPIGTAVAAIRELTIDAKKSTTSTDRDFGASKSSLEEVEARAKVGLPTSLIFDTAPYLGLKARAIRLRLSVVGGTQGDPPLLVLRIVGKEQLVEDIATEFKQKLIAAIGDAATVTIGSFSP